MDLVYIDPPFAASQNFPIDPKSGRANSISAAGQTAGSDRLQGAPSPDTVSQPLYRHPAPNTVTPAPAPSFRRKPESLLAPGAGGNNSRAASDAGIGKERFRLRSRPRSPGRRSTGCG